jgi:hypothetical protein
MEQPHQISIYRIPPLFQLTRLATVISSFIGKGQGQINGMPQNDRIVQNIGKYGQNRLLYQKNLEVYYTGIYMKQVFITIGGV